jgi:CubicO group peptidase (beta-lactamase class C family)
VTALDEARRVLHDAIARRIFPAASVDVGSSTGSLWRNAFGRLTFDPNSPSASETTAFDLASLTKVIATTSIVMDQVHRSLLSLDDRIEDGFGEWRGSGRESVTVQDLLEHASGLAARLLDAPPAGRREFEHEICTMPLEYQPRARSVYSDLGFILLGFLVADRAGRPLAAEFDALMGALQASEPELGTEPLSFGLSPTMRTRAAPTLPLDEDPRRNRRLVGEVHDNYAAALGGAAGHAGLFGTAAAVGAFARAFLRGARGDSRVSAPFIPSLVSRFTSRSQVAGSSRALGWDTMLATSSCGTRMSGKAIGHPGFTGTSLWIDPERDRYFVLLTNRASGGGTLDQMQKVRRAFHDALGEF